MTLSRWTDNSEKSMIEILENMFNFKEWYSPEIDPINGEELKFNIVKLFDENKQISINQDDFSYNYITYEYERIRPGEETNEMRSSRIYTISGFFIIYTDGTKTQYIVNRSGSDYTKAIIRKLNNYSKKLEITQHPFQVNEDIFIWMIFNVLNNSEESLEEGSHLYLKKIIGFKGSTNDQLAEVSGNGNRIMNLLSTLAFLFENEKVSYIKSRVLYKKDTIEFSLDLKGTIDIELDSYVGDYLFDDTYEKNSKIILKTLLEIVPKILTKYHLDIENDEWSNTKRKDFFTNIGRTIQDKILELIV